MDLKIKDVAELLNVSETTIRRWLADGKIPAYRINHQFRFNRLEIEDWVMGQKLGPTTPVSPTYTFSDSDEEQASTAKKSGGGSKQFSLYRAIHKGGVLHDIPGKTKEEVIRAAMKTIAAEIHLDHEVISELLLDREKLQPTALNKGIAIPHTRDFLLNSHFDMVTVVFPKEPIEYGAMDGKPVHTLFFLFASDDRRHLHLLAKVAHLSSQPDTLEMLKRKPSKEELLEYIRNWESTIQQPNDN